jgi:hypothetical protein
MWGPGIVGYGSYTYRYESGHSGDACLTGFAVRGKELVVYLIAENPEQVELLAKLGRHKMGKACLYFERLADLDVKSVRYSLPDRSQKSNAAIRAPATADHSLNRTRYGRPVSSNVRWHPERGWKYAPERARGHCPGDDECSSASQQRSTLLRKWSLLF